MRRAFGGLILLVACAPVTEQIAVPIVPETITDSVTFAGQTFPLRYTPTGDVVPRMGVGVTSVADDGTLVQDPDVTVYRVVAYPTVRVGGTTDKFRALEVWFARCAPGETFAREDYGDEVFTLDARTAEFVFTYPCPPLAGA